MKKKIAVIGAGPSGLVAGKYLKQRNFDVSIFETESKIGGTWNIDKGQPGLMAQSPKTAYCYTDFAYNDATSEFPTYQEIYNYLDQYANYFDLYSILETNTEVVEMQRQPDKDGWILSIRKNSQIKKLNFDFVVIANGIFNKKYIPEIANHNLFKGKVIHSMDFHRLDLLTGDNIIVVGAGKSGLHLATYIKNVFPGKEISLVFRKGRKIIPKNLLGLIKYNHLFFSPYRSVRRPYDDLPFFEGLTFNMLKPLNSFTSFLIKIITRKQLNLSQRDYFMPVDSNGCGASLEPNFYRETIDNINIYSDVTIKEYYHEGIALDNKLVLKANTIIFATGFKQAVDFLPTEYQQKIMDNDKQIWLYKHVMHPDLPDAAFVSYANGMNSILNSEICAAWIADYLTGNIHLPDRESMYNIIKTQKEYYKSFRYKNSALSSCVTPSDHFWIREMLQDMGKRKKKKLNSWLIDYLFTAYSKDYEVNNLEDIIK